LVLPFCEFMKLYVNMDFYGTPWTFLMDHRLNFGIQGGKRPSIFITHVLSYGSTFGIPKCDCGSLYIYMENLTNFTLEKRC
jgi:hypothetical protein